MREGRSGVFDDAIKLFYLMLCGVRRVVTDHSSISIYLSICLSVCLSVCLSIYLLFFYYYYFTINICCCHIIYTYIKYKNTSEILGDKYTIGYLFFHVTSDM